MGNTTPRKTKKGRTYRSRGLSVPPDIDALIDARIRSLNLPFSRYVISCVRRDLQSGGHFTISPDEEPLPPNRKKNPDRW